MLLNMPDLCDGPIENAPALQAAAPKIAVAVSSAPSALYALKWALEEEVSAHGLLYLIHVNSPLRWIPNAMGVGKFPVERVHPKMVRRFKREHLLETEKLVDQYRRICRKKKIISEVLYSESDSVQKELVDQIYKFGITKLVLGTSQNVLSRALKVESVSTYVAKHAPGFCVVLVVKKEKLCYVRNASSIIAPHADENGLLGPNISSANGSAVLVPEADLLQNQLNEVKLCADRGALREIELQTDNLKMAQEALEHIGRHQVALGEVKRAMQQVTKDVKRCEEAVAALERVQRESERRIQQKLAEIEVGRDALAALRRERQRYSEYSYEEIQSATNGFNEENKIGEGGYGPVYRGTLGHTSVAIKVLAGDGSRGHEEFQREVGFLSRIRHPHMLMLLGACPEKRCIVYEYMANGSLEDRLNCKDGTPSLPWYVRFRICFEVATALLFLHSQRPQPIVHCDLKPGNILLDHHFVSKIGDAGLARLVPENLTFSVTMYKDTVLAGTFGYIDPDYQRTGVVSCESDVYSLGIVMLQLLTGKPAVGVIHLVKAAQKKGKLEEVLDKSAGQWLLEEAKKLARISLQCTELKRRNRPKLEMRIFPVLRSIQNVAELAAANISSVGTSSSRMRPLVPSFFFCPILQEIMENPHTAADGFTYEHYAIKVWLQANNTSPMTNLRLCHKNLTPNHTLRLAIREWHDNGLI